MIFFDLINHRCLRQLSVIALRTFRAFVDNKSLSLPICNVWSFIANHGLERLMWHCRALHLLCGILWPCLVLHYFSMTHFQQNRGYVLIWFFYVIHRIIFLFFMFQLCLPPLLMAMLVASDGSFGRRGRAGRGHNHRHNHRNGRGRQGRQNNDLNNGGQEIQGGIDFSGKHFMIENPFDNGRKISTFRRYCHFGSLGQASAASC